MPEPSRASTQLRGMAFGALFLSLFGGGWMVVALNTEAAVWLLACALLPTSLLVLRALSLLHTGSQVRAAEPALTAAEADAERALNRGVNLLFAAEIGAIVLAANLLNAYGHALWILAATALLVAVFFLPLARLVRYPIYYATSGAELVLCGIIIALMHTRIGLADPLFGLIMALTLWLTVVVLLLQGARWGSGLLAQAPSPSPAAPR